MIKTALSALLAGMVGCASAQTTITASALRICASDNELPYANAKGEGFEDSIANVLGAAMGLPVERVTLADPRYIVRDLLDKDKCELMIGVDLGDPRVDMTKAYYRSSYVFLTRQADNLDVRDWKSPALQKLRLGAIPGTPAETMLTQIGRHSDSFNYMMSLGANKSMRNRYVKYDVEKMVNDLAAGRIDVAVAWAPAVGRYVKASSVPLRASPVPDAAKSNGEPVVFSYDTAIGVKKGNTALLKRVQEALDRSQPRIQQVLAAEGITALTQTAVSGLSVKDSGVATQ